MGIDLWYSIVWFYGMQVFFTPLSTRFAWSRTAMSGAFSLQRIQGLSQSATIVSGVTAPLLMGFIYDTTDSYQLSLYALIVITLLALPLVALASPPQFRKP